MTYEEQQFIKLNGERPLSGKELDDWQSQRIGWLQCLSWLARIGYMPSSYIKRVFKDEQ